MFVAAVIMATAPVIGLTQAAPPKPDGDSPKAVAQAIDSHLAGMMAKDFAGVVLLAQGNELLLHKAYGLADREAKRPMTTETGFDIGSIVKPITRAAIYKLKEQGKLTFEDKVPRFFDGVPADKVDITVQQLLTHKGGLPDALGNDYELITRDDLVRKVLESTLLHAPGSKSSYSNCGYATLGAIIEKVSGQPYEKYVYEQVLVPGGAKRIGYKIPNWTNEQLAIGYRGGKRWGSPIDHPWLEDGPSWHLRANGGMLGTAHELHLWVQNLLAGKVLNSENTEAYKSASIRPDKNGKRSMMSAGGNGIFNTLYAHWPDSELVFILFTNVAEACAECDEVLQPIRTELESFLRKN